MLRHRSLNLVSRDQHQSHRSYRLIHPNGRLLIKIAMIAALGLELGCLNRSGSRPAPLTPPSADRRDDKAKSPAKKGGVPKANPGEGAPKGEPPVVTPPLTVGTNQSISLFEKSHVYWTSDRDDKRTISRAVDLPPEKALYKSITLNIRLECPSPSCDFWDRRGSILLTNPDGSKIELARFVTPYRVGARWSMDVSHLAPILNGKQTLEVFIDTWVGPGHAQGAGWLVTATLDFVGGRRDPYPLAVIPIFPSEIIEVGDPARTPRRTFRGTLPPGDFRSASLYALITGHGQGNTENCAEFCSKRHILTINEETMEKTIWRSDCGSTATDGRQQGTWTYPRAGWCPGAAVTPAVFPLATMARDLTITYEPEPYVNQNRQGYNDSSHTPPVYQVSSVLVLFGP